MSRSTFETVLGEVRKAAPGAAEKLHHVCRLRRVSALSERLLLMNEKVDLKGNPDTGRWTAKYKGKTHRYPKVARSKNGETPKEVMEWAGLLVTQHQIDKTLGKHFR